jgi:hypothetical protein
MLNRTRLVLAGLVALLALSSVMAAPVSAHPGPFWRQRAVGTTGNGVKITRAAQEKFQSKGKLSILSVAGGAVKVECLEAQDKGTIWNNNFQGQGKAYVEFHHNCKVIGNGEKCKVVEPIRFSAFFHLAWKWDGSAKQLEQGNQQELGQKPDLIFTHSEVEGGPISKTENFVTIEFKECELINGAAETQGFESAQLYPTQTETWVKEAAFLFTPGKHLQHYWNGKAQEGVETELKVGGFEGTFSFEDQAFGFAAANGEPVEIAAFEN